MINLHQSINRIFKENSKIIDDEIFKFLNIQKIKIKKIIEFALKPKGHRERPFLMKLACESVGGEYNIILPAAIAVELFHFSTLIIDDFLDESSLRGGVISVYSAHGAKKAVIIGEILNSVAHAAMSELYSNDKIPVNRILKSEETLKETYKELYIGQFLDLDFEYNQNITEKQYMEMISKTTASLIICSLKIGAILGGGNIKEINSISTYGKFLGVAFQIKDDVLEIIGNVRLIGKQLGGDIKQKKMRLPFIMALQLANEKDRNFLLKTFKRKKNNEKSLKKCFEIIKDSGSIDQCKRIIKVNTSEAIESLNSLKTSSAKNGMIAFANVIGDLW